MNTPYATRFRGFARSGDLTEPSVATIPVPYITLLAAYILPQVFKSVTWSLG